MLEGVNGMVTIEDITCNISNVNRLAKWWMTSTPQNKRLAMAAADRIAGGISDVVQLVVVDIIGRLQRRPVGNANKVSTVVAKQSRWTCLRLINTPSMPRSDPAFNLTVSEDNDDQLDAKEIIAREMRCLKYRERIVLQLRFGLGDGYEYTLRECGIVLGLSKDRVSQIESKAIGRIQYHIGQRLRRNNA